MNVRLYTSIKENKDKDRIVSRGGLKGDMMINQALIRKIPELHECKEIIQIEKGFSADKKYTIHTEKNQKRLLRIFDSADMKQKQQEYGL